MLDGIRKPPGQRGASIDIGLVTSVGYVAEHDEVARRWENSGLDILREKARTQVPTAAGKPVELQQWADGLTTPTTTNKVNYSALVRAAGSQEEAGAVIATALAKCLSRALSVPEEDIDIGKPAHLFGVDSLVAVELQFWFTNEIKADISVFNVLSNNSIADLGVLAAGKSEYHSDLRK